MMKTTRLYPRVHLDAAEVPAVGQAGGALLARTAELTGLTVALHEGLGRWRKPTARHDPAKTVLDLAIAVALGGDAMADVAVLRAEPGLYGPVASEATVSRTVAALAGDADRVLRAVAAARTKARAAAWAMVGQAAPNHEISEHAPLIVDLDATLLTSFSEKEGAAPTFKHGFGFHPSARSWTTALTGPGRSWRSCSGQATPGRTLLPTTSPSPSRLWPRCPE